MTKIIVTIPTFNASSYIITAIRSFLERTDLTNLSVWFMIMDNSDREEHRFALVREFASMVYYFGGDDRYPQVGMKIFYSRFNMKFSPSQNFLIRQAEFWDAVILLNDDVEIRRDHPLWLQHILEKLDNDLVGSVCPVSTYRNGRIYYAGIDEPRTHRFMGIQDNPKIVSSPTSDSPWNNMACCGISRRVWELVGPLNEKQAHYGSDETWGRKAVSLGLRNVVIPDRIYHYNMEPKRK